MTTFCAKKPRCHVREALDDLGKPPGLIVFRFVLWRADDRTPGIRNEPCDVVFTLTRDNEQPVRTEHTRQRVETFALSPNDQHMGQTNLLGASHLVQPLPIVRRELLEDRLVPGTGGEGYCTWVK